MLADLDTQPFPCAVPVAKRLTVEKLTEHTCKWPIGDPRTEDFHFCGHASLKVLPYCLYHARLAYRSNDRPIDSRRHHEQVQHARK